MGGADEEEDEEEESEAAPAPGPLPEDPEEPANNPPEDDGNDDEDGDLTVADTGASTNGVDSLRAQGLSVAVVASFLALLV